MPRQSPQDVLTRLRACLAEGAPGARLPAERVLAADLGCSRQTLRAALSVLEEEGEIWRHVGQGTFRGPRPPGHPVRDSVLLQAASARQLLQARLMIEPPVAAEAARAAQPRDIAHLRALVDRGRQARTRAEGEALDTAFHRGVAETARNPILLGLLDYLAGARRRAAWQREWDRTYRRIGTAEFTGPHCTQHARIATAIATADPQAAAAAMRTHLEAVGTAMGLS